MSKADNRYLNLAGAPWSPDNPNRYFTLTNLLTGAATGLVILGAAEISKAVEQRKLTYIFEGVATCLVTSAFAGRRRQKEAKKLCDGTIGRMGDRRDQAEPPVKPEPLSDRQIIDMQPDGTTPPTSDKMMARIGELKGTYHRLKILSDTLPSAAYRSASVLYCMRPFLLIPNGDVTVIFMSWCAASGSDILTRYRQIKKIENREWAIIGDGNAVNKFGDKERKLALQ